MKYYISLIILMGICLLSCKKDDNGGSSVPKPGPIVDSSKNVPVSQKPRILWIDAPANFKYLANKRENITKYLESAREAGFNHIVVDVRPTSGDVLFKSSIVDEVRRLNGIERTESWDYLRAFIDDGHKKHLKVYANLNTMVGGDAKEGGVMYREKEKAAWASVLYNSSGLASILDASSQKAPQKFFNPVNPDVQQYVLSILKELISAYPDLDGVMLDRARFSSIESDFSDLTKKEFEKYIGESLDRFPNDILTWSIDGKFTRGKYFKEWLEFRAKVIYDFFSLARATVKSINPKIEFGTYTGSWYSTYYNEGVNWASKKYDPSQTYDWASKNYKNFGYAGLLDVYMTGAYGKALYGPTNEWSVEGAIINAKKIVKSDVGVIGGLYGLNYENKPSDAEEASFIALTKGDGLMYFDMIYLIMYNQWADVKKGIERALATEKK